MFTKKLERGRFIWPSAADGTVAWAARLSAGRHRLADAAKDLATNIGWMSKNTGMAGANMIPSPHEQTRRPASK
ncbi:hypothetical protein [Agrobacterium tumefaciens]|uniref:hypothetical protein n=1 Tax=Agrobacterium tumefaciens TaxID=358 RepID=UPI003969DAA4